jgi:hypothetical protein
MVFGLKVLEIPTYGCWEEIQHLYSIEYNVYHQELWNPLEQ